QPTGITGQTLNELNQQLLTEINRSAEVFLTATDLDGCFTIRICVLCFRTHLERLEACVQHIRDACLLLDPTSS
ncbi:MAG: hypothetical protein GY917_17195, partial [Planctomycetaceae bacterium]|nr:hypothetical protein [Planctomycetaceae bacterium]